MPSSPIATRKTPAIFMITINRWVRGRFLTVWIFCLYVNRGALRAFSVTGGTALSVTPPGPRSFLLPPRFPRVAPPPIPPRFSVLASEGEISAGAPRAGAAGPQALSPELGRPVSKAGRARGVLPPLEPRRLASGPAAGRGASELPAPPLLSNPAFWPTFMPPPGQPTRHSCTPLQSA